MFAISLVSVFVAVGWPRLDPCFHQHHYHYYYWPPVSVCVDCTARWPLYKFFLFLNQTVFSSFSNWLPCFDLFIFFECWLFLVLGGGRCTEGALGHETNLPAWSLVYGHLTAPFQVKFFLCVCVGISQHTLPVIHRQGWPGYLCVCVCNFLVCHNKNTENKNSNIARCGHWGIIVELEQRCGPFGRVAHWVDDPGAWPPLLGHFSLPL